MKTKQIILAFFLSLPILSGAQPHLSVSATEHDFGLLTRNKPATASFTLTNIGNDPLQLARVTTSCACTLAEWPEQPIPPGGKAVITATFDAKMMGRFHKFINIYSNSQPALMRLSLKGEVLLEGAEQGSGLTEQIGDFLLNTRNIEFDPVGKGEKPKAVIELLNTSKHAIDLNLLHLPPYLSMKAIPQTLAARRKGQIILTLETDYLKEYGLTQTPLYLARYSADKVSNDNEIMVSSILLPDFSNLSTTQLENAPRMELSETEFDLGTVKNKGSVSRTILVSNVGKSRLEIKTLQVFNPAVSLTLGKRYLRPGETSKLKMKLNGKLFYKMKGETKALMITNDPENPYVMIQLNAQKEPVKQ